MRCRALVVPFLLLLATACAEGDRFAQALCVLVDVSGTYADESSEVVRILKRDVLPDMVPGDSLVVIRIDSESYERENVEALLTLDPRPSRANAQKLALAERLDALAARGGGSSHTDLPGAMMLGAEYLRELGSGSRVMLVFSDLREDLPAGARRNLGAGEFEGIRVVAVNVKRLRDDRSDPDAFRARLAAWERRVVGAGALGWQTFADPGRLGAYLRAVREGAA